jgi:hypothetical protein
MVPISIDVNRTNQSRRCDGHSWLSRLLFCFIGTIDLEKDETELAGLRWNRERPQAGTGLEQTAFMPELSDLAGGGTKLLTEGSKTFTNILLLYGRAMMVREVFFCQS